MSDSVKKPVSFTLRESVCASSGRAFGEGRDSDCAWDRGALTFILPAAPGIPGDVEIAL